MATRELQATELTELERWFLDRGIPHFIADYNSSTRVWTRALPFLLTTYLLASLPVGADTWRDAGVEFAATMGCIVAVWVLLNLFRRQRIFSAPTRIGRVELAVYVFGPTSGHLLLGEVTDAAIAAAIQVVLLVGAYLVTSYALIPLSVWTLRRSVDSLRIAGAAMARALPLLLLVVTFFFLTAEVWQVFGRLQGLPYGFTLLLFLVAGAAFAANRGRKELDVDVVIDDGHELVELIAGTPAEALQSALPSGAPQLAAGDRSLTRRQRINLLMVIVVNQVLLAIVVAAAIGLFFLVFGFLGIGGDVIEAWVLHPPHPLWTVSVSGRSLVLSEELIRVTGFLATFSGFYFGVQSTTDPQLREGLDDFAEDNVRQLFAMRQVYLASHGSGLAG